MLTLSRGGPTIWISEPDAAKIGVRDNEWVEAVNRNGVVVARAVVTHKMPEGTVYMYHAQERVIDVPNAETYGPARRHPQLADPAAHQAHPPHRRVRAAVVRVQLPRPDRQPARRGHHDPPPLPGGGVLTCSVMAQMAMVMNLDKCIGCHTCSVTCKQAWTNRSGVEYVWFNNVETRPGQGYPRTYQDQERWQGGWVRTRAAGSSRARAGGSSGCCTIFANPKLPSMQDYYEPWTYDYEHLLTAPGRGRHPGRPAEVAAHRQGHEDHLVGQLGRLARRRQRDGRRRPDPGRRSPTACGWSTRRRSCSSCRASASTASTRPARRPARPGRSTSGPRTASCWSTRTAAAAGGCVSPAARTRRSTSTTAPARRRSARSASRASRSASPTICSETCVGRLRYIGLMLYDADAVRQGGRGRGRARAVRGAALGVPRPERPAGGRRGRARPASPRTGSSAAQRSPIWDLIMTYQVALPLHPEYRTMPMVWYIPPLSPVVDVAARHRPRRRGRGQPVRRRRRAAHPGGVPGRALHRRRPGPGRPRCCAGSPRCAPTSAGSTSARSATSRSPPPSA